jgi:hypothetical protein
LEDGYVSLSPLGFDLTRHTALPHFEKWRDAVVGITGKVDASSGESPR